MCSLDQPRRPDICYSCGARHTRQVRNCGAWRGHLCFSRLSRGSCCPQAAPASTSVRCTRCLGFPAMVLFHESLSQRLEALPPPSLFFVKCLEPPPIDSFWRLYKMGRLEGLCHTYPALYSTPPPSLEMIFKSAPWLHPHTYQNRLQKGRISCPLPPQPLCAP